MSNKTMMGITLATATLALSMAPIASFADNVDCYGANNAKDSSPVQMESAEACENAGGTTTKPDATLESKPAPEVVAPMETQETPAS